MSLETSDLIQSFVEDCREHLDSIESWLMDIEAAGDNQNPELVNSVFRLAHSIKGGAGMLGLDNIKTLAHKLENVLHMVRSQELAPTHEVVNVLLRGFDRLTSLVDKIEDSESMPIDAEVAQLLAISTGGDEAKAAAATPASVDVGEKRIFSVDALSLEQAKSGGNELYLLEFDLIHDIHGKGKLPFELLKTLADTGRIVDCKVDFAAVGDLDAFGNSIPFYVLFATILEPKYISGLVKLPEERVRHIDQAADAVRVELPAKSRHEFGPVTLNIDNGAGWLSVPAEVSDAVLAGLKQALVAGMDRCTDVKVDLAGVKTCDLFLMQLMCCARHSYKARGKGFTAAGPLQEELRAAGAAQGFCCGSDPGCLFQTA
jgi:HPt (histidine-containing phosphotransfer) domain-containing protein